MSKALSFARKPICLSCAAKPDVFKWYLHLACFITSEQKLKAALILLLKCLMNQKPRTSKESFSELNMADYQRLPENKQNSSPVYNFQYRNEHLSSAASTVKSSKLTRNAYNSGLPNLKRRYIPSLYHNQDKELTQKVKEFLKKPPLNSQEYFDMLWLRRRSEPFGNRDEAGTRIVNSARSSPDEVTKKLWHLLPENQTIQSMILPPIRDGCVSEFHRKHSSKTVPFIDPSVNIMDQLKYCRYLRAKPARFQAWESRNQDIIT